MSQSLVSVVVSVWNRVELTAQFLSQVWPWIEKHNAELVVVNDGSTDQTPKMLSRWGLMRPAHQLRVVHHAKNQGFGPSYNRGVEEATGPYLILINNDVEIRGNFIKKIRAHLNSRPDILVCGRLVDWESGWNTFNSGTFTVPYAEGWLLGCHRDTWNLLGGFDERYVPCDFEDVDFSMIAKQKEVDIVELDLPLIHRAGSTTRQLGDREAITRKHRKLFMKKWGLKP